MIDYMKRHEKYVLSLLEAGAARDALCELLAYHDRQIAWMQHERLAHLITLMFVCLFFFMSFGFTMLHFLTPNIVLTALLLILTVAYILHYYRLENGVQRWYAISNRIRSKLMDLK